MTAFQWGAPARPVSIPGSVCVHQCRRPELVVFAGPFVTLPAHFIRGDRFKRGRSAPCTGLDCPHCAAGVRQTVNHYAPALVRPEQLDGVQAPAWSRVAYYVPQGAASEMRVQRNAYYLLWPQPVGCVMHVKSRFLGEIGYSVEPTWDVRPVVAYAMDDSPEAADARSQLLMTLPRLVVPKTVGEVEQERGNARAAFTRQEAAEQQTRQRVEMEALREEMREVLRSKLAERGIPNADEVIATKGTGTIICGEMRETMDGIKARRAGKAGAA